MKWKLGVKFLTCVIAFVVAGAALLADVTVQQKRGLTTYKMVITPAAESNPAFKHRLTVGPHETIPGNAVTHYLRSFGESGLTSPWKRAEEKFGREIHEWYSPETDLSDVPIESLREVSGMFDSYVRNHIARATKCRDCEWGLAEEELYGVELFTFPLSSVQQTRSISRVLALRTRLAIQEGRFDDAVEHLRMNYQLARNVGEMKFLVAGLVGIAEVGIANYGMIDLIGAEGSPNMYWSLAELPHPLIDIREAIRLELTWGVRFIPELLDVETAEHSEEEWARILYDAGNVVASAGMILNGGQQGSNTGSFPTTAIALASFPSAKKRLIDSGLDAKKVEAMPVGQVLMIDLVREYRRIAHEHEKSLYFSYRDAGPLFAAAEGQLDNGLRTMSFGKLLAGQLLPALMQVRAASARIHWQRNALQVIEAIRMHVAQTGAFPKSLDEITAVPVPLNPLTNKQYVYWIDEDKAVLDMPRSDGMPGIAQRFELELAK